MIKKIFLKLKEKLCRHDYKPSGYYVIDNNIECIDICSKCGKRKITDYSIEQESHVKSLGYKKDFCGSIWANAIRNQLKILSSVKKLETDPEAKTIKIIGFSRPSIEKYSIEESDK